MTQIKIGSRVITRKFEDQYRWPDMIQCNDKEGIVTNIASDGWITVHNWSWPPSAVEPIDPPFQPEYGKEYEFSKQSNFASYRTMRFIAKDGDNFVGQSLEDKCYYGYPYVRPIHKGLEDELKDFVSRKCSYDPDDAYRELNSIIAKHRTEPSDEEILTHWREHDSYSTLSVIATVRHFLSKP